MSWHDKSFIVGEQVKVKNESVLGVVTRIEDGYVYIMFERMREVSYKHPESLHDNTIKPFVTQR